ncbi:HisA/HisF-related TIM barrel protein [Variovorax sp. J2P1-59]|uniref:HisA/HisF-related TIM barrel protein n=1 Tax=Variovorax flavidus TaxID=3053501 RepID=UPI0025780016|nr:HisA/HisF-related TIM barrel protein [Variovorax sp. J2P1-59]MDM0073262.1 HisA/HisF-related TIM barrel protein [Variovorax sp. J2P1-59]
MNLIPVIDLMQGQVVRAVRGNRQAYRPIESRLCHGSDPVTVAKILCEHCATRQLYVADLDALLGRPSQTAVLRTLLQAMPGLELWLDAGFANAGAADALRLELGDAGSQVVPVFGSESLASREELERCFGGNDEGVLSLDRRDGQHLDAAGCWNAPALWPGRVIVMTLERVGAGAGPDLETLAEVRRQSPSTFFVGAGGIRNQSDLEAAGEAGARAWLVASALHDGGLPRVRG